MNEAYIAEAAENWKPVKVRIVGCKGRHGFATGIIVTITKIIPDESNTPYYAVDSSGNKYYLHKDDFEYVKIVRGHLNAKLNDLLTEKEELERKLNYLDSTNQDEANESEYKLHQALAIIKNESDEAKQTRMIADLINS